MSVMKILGVDPSLTNFGMALFSLDLDTLELTLEDLELVQTEKEKAKQLRRSSDDLRRAHEISTRFYARLPQADMIFAEIPSGAQDSRASYAFGLVVGILSTVSKPLIQVQPVEAKVAATGNKNATKPQMIEWGVKRHPGGNWLRARNKPTGALVAANEHLADACAIVEAGLMTKEFRNLLAMRGAMAA